MNDVVERRRKGAVKEGEKEKAKRREGTTVNGMGKIKTGQASPLTTAIPRATACHMPAGKLSNMAPGGRPHGQWLAAAPV
jgi:hypothetical protein